MSARRELTVCSCEISLKGPLLKLGMGFFNYEQINHCWKSSFGISLYSCMRVLLHDATKALSDSQRLVVQLLGLVSFYHRLPNRQAMLIAFFLVTNF